MKSFKKYIVIVLMTICLSAGVISIDSCTKKPVVVNAPTGVNDKAVADWYQATGAMLAVSEGAKAGPQVIATLYSSKAVDDEYKTSALNLMKDFDTGCLHIVDVLKASPNNFNASTKTQVFTLTQSMLDELQKFNTEGGTHIKNPDSVAGFNTLLASIKLALTTTQSLAGGK